MTNTIPNVPRYRVEKTGRGFWPYCVRAGDGTREVFVGHQKQCAVVAAELETAFEDGKFVSCIAPSPAGVDGLEVFAVDIQGREVADCVRYDQHRAIIDGLRGEVERLQRAEKNDAIAYKAALERQDELRTERDQQAQRIGELEGLLRHAQKQVPTGSGLHMRIDAALSAVCAAAPNIATTSEHSGS